MTFLLIQSYVKKVRILKGFSFAMIIGVIVGTYSSIFVATPILNYTNVNQKTILKEDKDVDQISNSLKGLFDELIISTVPNAQLMSIDELNLSLIHI